MKKITLTHINNLLKLFESGLVNGAGHDVNHFCVQQAVHRVMDDDLKNPKKTDNPPSWCVKEELRSFGVRMNDSDGWHDNAARAEGLKRFAIAELGSNKINNKEFYKRLAIKITSLTHKDPGDFTNDYSIIDEFMCLKVGGIDRNDRLTWLANAAADVLMELGTQGSRFLYLIDEPDKKKREEKARALGHKIYAAQLADSASSCSWGVPQQSKHH